MRKIFSFVALILLLALPGVAQEHPKAEVFLGYSFARLDTGAPGHQNMHGWNGAIQGNVTPWLGVVADFSGHYGTRTDPATGGDLNINTHQALFGPRISLPAKIRPFAHALFGVARGNAKLFGSTGSESAFGMAVGGGIDAQVSDHVSWRVVQGDYLMTRFLDVNRNNFRLATGLVFRW